MSRIRQTASAAVAAGVVAATLLISPAAEATTLETAKHVTQCPYTAHDLRRLPEMEEQIGAPIDCALVFSDTNRTWAEWERPWFAYSPFPQHQWDSWVRQSGGRNTLVMTFTMIPREAPADWRARGARGEYDAHVRKLATNLVARGLGNSVIRIGAEANGDWRIDQIGDTERQRREWAQYWARIARVAKSVPGARFTFDWTINGGYRPIPFEQYYPGDDVVDIIGVDQYDSLWEQRTGNRFSEIYHQRGGVRDIAAFARSRGKPLSLPEVGLVSRAQRGAGDDPAYVRGLASVASTTDMAYVGYFDHHANGVLRLRDVPASAAQWRASFGAGKSLAAVAESLPLTTPGSPRPVTNTTPLLR